MKAIVLSVGDELVLGQTVDTNSAWISRQLSAVGIDIHSHATVGDVQADIEAALRDAIPRADAVIVSGGIGPTEDDVTRQSLAVVMGVPLATDEGWLTHILGWFERLGRKMPETNKVQALIPRGATMIWNHLGTAAGVAAKVDGKPVFLMPGVPKEMQGMFTRDVLPALATGAGGKAIVQRLVHTFGVGESTVAERLGDLMKRGRNPSVGTTVAGGAVSVRINSRFDSKEEAAREADATFDLVRGALGDLIYGEDGGSLALAVMSLMRNRPPGEKPITVSTAESCTGGLLAKYLTDEPGSSTHFECAWVTYSNEAKTKELGVDAKLIESKGAVSEEVATAMATGAHRKSAASYALAITGIAGPDGGSEAKPVGTVCIALAADDGVQVMTFRFPGDREMVRDRSAKMALTMLRFKLMGKPLPF
jgi:nicotinamide-nucleotide amidase